MRPDTTDIETQLTVQCHVDYNPPRKSRTQVLKQGFKRKQPKSWHNGSKNKIKDRIWPKMAEKSPFMGLLKDKIWPKMAEKSPFMGLLGSP